MRALLILAAVLVGCVEDNFEKRSELFRYRVIGIQADQPEARPEATVTFNVIEHIPAGTGPVERRWSVCLLSAGAVAQYECSDPRLRFRFVTTEPTLTLDFGPGGFLGPLGFRGSYALAQAEVERLREGDPDALIPELPDLEDGVRVYVQVDFQPEGADRVEQAVKTLVIRDGDDLNQNPRVASIMAPLNVFVGQTVPLRVGVAEGSEETYETSINEDSDRCEQVGEDSYRCTEELTYSWYSTAPEVTDPVGFADLRDTNVEMPLEPGPVEVVVVIRDGRGGLDAARRTLRVLRR